MESLRVVGYSRNFSTGIPFCGRVIVINADDYYGKEGFKAVHEYLVNGGKSCMAGFVLKNTLSDNGGVTRGICKMDLSAKIAAADHVMQKKGMYLGGYRPFGFLPDPNDCHLLNGQDRRTKTG